MNRPFVKGNKDLLRKACENICSKLHTMFTRDHGIKIYRDAYGYIAIPITDGHNSYYLIARSYVWQGIVSIEEDLVLLAKRHNINFIMYIDSIQNYIVFSPHEIVENNLGVAYRGDKRYIDFRVSIGIPYQAHLKLRRYKPDTPTSKYRCNRCQLQFASRRAYRIHLKVSHK